MQLKVKKAFLWAFRGCDVVAFEPGQTIPGDDQDLVRVATEQGWVEGEEKKIDAPENKAKKPPENKKAK